MAKTSEETFEEGKSVEEYTADSALVDELNSLEIEPEPFPSGQPLENVAEVIQKQVKKKEEEKKNVIPVPVVSLRQEIPQVKVPIIEPSNVNVVEPRKVNYVAPSDEELPLPPPPPGFEKEVRPSFDGAISNILSVKKKAIFDKAEKDADQVETNFYNNLFSAFDAIANGSPLPTVTQQQVAQPLMQPQPVPIPVVKEVEPVKNGNEDAIRLLRLEIQAIDLDIIDLDPKGAEAKVLYLAKQRLQNRISMLDGTWVEPPFVSKHDAKGKLLNVKLEVVEKPKKSMLKAYIATLSLSGVVGFLLWMTLSLGHII